MVLFYDINDLFINILVKKVKFSYNVNHKTRTFSEKHKLLFAKEIIQ